MVMDDLPRPTFPAIDVRHALVYGNLPPSRMDNYGGVTWAVHLLPFLEQEPFYRQWNINHWYYDQGPNGNATRQTQLKISYCPSRQRQLRLSQNNDVPEVPFSGAPANAARQGFGVISDTSIPMRQVQLALKYSF